MIHVSAFSASVPKQQSSAKKIIMIIRAYPIFGSWKKDSLGIFNGTEQYQFEHDNSVPGP
jgi:hypothetical protein